MKIDKLMHPFQSSRDANGESEEITKTKIKKKILKLTRKDDKTSKTETSKEETKNVIKSERKNSFSYLDLLNKDGGAFPHRTQYIGDSKSNSRRNSLTTSNTIQTNETKSVSIEYLNQTRKSDLMVRSNPIGLAEPSIKVRCINYRIKNHLTKYIFHSVMDMLSAKMVHFIEALNTFTLIRSRIPTN